MKRMKFLGLAGLPGFAGVAADVMFAPLLHGHADPRSALRPM
jgi:hypothetical protein